MRTRSLLGGLGLACICLIGSAVAQQPITQVFKTRWVAPIGNTSFKTNILLYQDRLIVGSNGKHFRDWRLDEGSGLYILNPKTGKTIHHLEGETLGDLDVNGVLGHRNRLFFGNDNDEFFCYDLEGNLIWSRPVSGDVECRPILLDVDQDQEPELIIATETGELCAMELDDGAAVWRFRTPGFSGWKETDNRFLFKVSSYGNYGDGFYREPVLADLNGDEVADLVLNGRDGHTYAVDGQSGQSLWRFKHDRGYFDSKPLVSVRNGKTQVMVCSNKGSNKGYTVLHANGQVKQTVSTTASICNTAVPLVTPEATYIGAYEGILKIDQQTGKNTFLKIPRIKSHSPDWGSYTYSVSMDAELQLADLLGTGSNQLIFPDQLGYLHLLDPKTGKTLKRLKLPQNSESTPLIADVDGNGKLDIVIGCLDGKLYCYETAGKAKKIVVKPAPKLAQNTRMY